MKVIIAGGRDFVNYDVLKNFCDYILVNQDDVEIISGNAVGADALGERYAKERGYKLTLFPADWDKHGKKAGFIRNSVMANVADGLIAFHDGVSKGTAMMIKLAQEKNLKVRVKRY
jgi:hypothetical protein